jgi:hypothetical protein
MLTVWEIVKELEGKSINTLVRKKPFKIHGVLDDRIIYIPKTSGSPRWSYRKDIEYLVELRKKKGKLSPSDIAAEFPKEYNSSYMAAVVDTVYKTLQKR